MPVTSGHKLCVVISDVCTLASRVVPSLVIIASPANSAPAAIRNVIATPIRARFLNNATDITSATTESTVTPKKYLKPVENIIPTFERKPRTTPLQKLQQWRNNKARVLKPNRDHQSDHQVT